MTQNSPPTSRLDIEISDMVGRRVLNIYGFQQQDVADLDDDASSWWLEFEGGIWMTVTQIIAPAYVDPLFQLQFRFFQAAHLPVHDSSRFTKNPAEFAPLLGLHLLEQLETVCNGIYVMAVRLGFGSGERITKELHIGYLDGFKGDSWPGMGAKLLSTDCRPEVSKPAISDCSEP